MELPRALPRARAALARGASTNTVEVTLSGVRTTRVTIEHHGFEEELLPVHRESWRRMLGELARAVERRGR